MNLFQLRFDMKTLMTVAIIGAAIIGEWAEGAVVVILFAISEALERYSMDKARQSIRSLMNIAPKEAQIRRNGEMMTVHVNDIQVGDVMIVRPGQKLAMDGVVISGTTSINEAAITGESMPVEKTIDDNVFAGTLNEEGYLEVEVTKRAEDTTLAKIIHLVEEAQAKRAPSQAFIDRFAKYYTPAIMVVALLVAIVPPLALGADWHTWVYQGLAVLVVGCPCALVISTPVSIVTAIGNAAKNGILVKGGIYLEQVGALNAIAFDKTGTLTEGVPVVTDYESLIEDDSLFAKIAAIESHSQHPLAAAIVRKAESDKRSGSHFTVEGFTSLTGGGVEARVNGQPFTVGKPSLFSKIMKEGEGLQEKVTALQEQGKTVMLAATPERVVALIAVADQVRSSSQQVIDKLHELGIRETVMLTGDNKKTAAAIAQNMGVSRTEAELLPEDKLTLIEQLNEKHRSVAMVGDGVNDAPALARADVGIAMGGAGTDTALETADVALMNDDLEKLPFVVRLSRKALNIIKQNIAFSLGLKALALLLVIPGWLTLWIAIIADMGATLLVTLNGMRLMREKPKQ
ncbi:Cd2+/Zn2+-exporting ATPase [Texcoconibacillus texcoconensis]|uniref:Cd(2+)-exporting ATPase n=1 Tax=Texcoconibacillus texcoconensis TaxID=1095777 RepID=A0A840QRR4_9BACI|nr:Cd2+/Zn2+-exporting ATPase [Texcoconibacillus texcoconensis]